MIEIFTNPNFKDVNAYIVHNDTNKAVLIDTAFGMHEEINAFLEKKGMVLTDIFITHTHFDHIVGLNEICEANNEPTVHVSLPELEGFISPIANQSSIYTVVNPKPFACRKIKNMKMVKDGDILEINGNSIRVISMPAHTNGSVMYDFMNLRFLFNGDNIFYKTHAITEKDISNIEEEYKIAEELDWMLKTFPGGYLFFPGHYKTPFHKVNIAKNNVQLIKMIDSTFTRYEQ